MRRSLALIWLGLVAAAPTRGQFEPLDESFPHDPEHPAAGLWVGDLSVGPRAQFGVLAIERDGGGTWSAKGTAAFLLALGTPCREVAIDGRAVALTFGSVMGVLSLDGSISDDGQRLAGSLVLTKPGREARPGTFEMARTMRAADAPLPITLGGTLQVPGGGGIQVTLVLAATPGGNWVAEIDIPLQGVRGLPLVNVDRDGQRFTATLAGPADALIAGALKDGDARFRGTLTQHGMVIPMVLVRAGEAVPAGPARPQHPKPPFPYETREVVVTHERGYSLAGTLTIPRGPGPHPAAVLVSGSGQQDRDETVFDHKPFLVIADHLTRHGSAVLRYDDRGVGESTGIDTLATATSEDFADDTRAVVKHLRSIEGIDPDRVGLIGHSEGGMIAPMVAAQDKRIAFVVLLAGTGVPGREVLLKQNRLIFAARGAEGPALDLIEHRQREALDLVVAGADDDAIRPAIRALIEAQLAASPHAAPGDLDTAVELHLKVVTVPWMRFFITYDPRPALARLECPVLALGGTLDLQVFHEQNLTEIERTVREAGGDVTARRYEGLNHLFQPATTGVIGEYSTIEVTVDEGVLGDIVEWIDRKVR